ncbi:MAG: hypothetical protein OIF35_07345, partial [Cellvibrionaceae bacterium]|nr:hypothetical protein [Cellvibrionaceae bacterium]
MGNVDTGYAVAAIGFLLGFGFLQGLILVAALLWSGQARGLAGRFMAALIGLISIHLAYRWLGVGAVWSQYPQLSLLPAALVYCWGPLLYLYAYSMSRRRVSRWQFLHFLPSLLIGLLIATTLFYPEQAQQGLAQFI